MWKDVKGFENLYSVNECGDILSKKRNKILAPILSPKGYRCVHLSKKGKVSFLRIARLVSVAFIENPLNYPQVNHKDGIKENDFVTNLEWCTQSQNIQHGIKNGLYSVGENHFSAKLSNTQVAAIRNRSKNGESYRSLSNEYGVAFETISAIVRRKQRKYE